MLFGVLIWMPSLVFRDGRRLVPQNSQRYVTFRAWYRRTRRRLRFRNRMRPGARARNGDMIVSFLGSAAREFRNLGEIQNGAFARTRPTVRARRIIFLNVRRARPGAIDQYPAALRPGRAKFLTGKFGRVPGGSRSGDLAAGTAAHQYCQPTGQRTGGREISGGHSAEERHPTGNL